VACIQPDGTLSRSGELILLAVHAPATPEEVARETGLDLFVVRAAMREFLQADYVEKVEDRYRLTPKGEAALEGVNPDAAEEIA
jgi:predicted transcriptional regulator